MELPGQPGILIGYDNANTAYCIVRLSDSKVSVTHHETFNKNSFPSLPYTIENTLPLPLDFNITTPTSNNDTGIEVTGTRKPTPTTQEIEEKNHEEQPAQHS
ncbi:hypothetical protein O181_083788 [Austropuccinia psidii MF-1]|uniref:Uncharacterized protein n=1 Tax=Austropuccinia psidii MF-1 TaxID=1389203 RepID=A0A9Q3IJX3_9BASI|nr:hypothetical protein [Austropuccinia psidii MF-1]